MRNVTLGTVTDVESPHAGRGRLRANLSNRIVQVYKEHYGRGPTVARTFIEDEFVFTVLEDGLLRNELTLVAGGEHELVSTYRSHLSAVVEPLLCEAVQEATGRRVVAHYAQTGFDPPRSIEVFVLDGPLDVDAA